MVLLGWIKVPMAFLGSYLVYKVPSVFSQIRNWQMAKRKWQTGKWQTENGKLANGKRKMAIGKQQMANGTKTEENEERNLIQQ